MIQQETLDEQVARLEEEEKTREFYWKDERAKEAHERKLKKVEVRATHLSDALISVTRIIFMLPVMFVLALFVPVIILSGKEVPEFLQDMFKYGG